MAGCPPSPPVSLSAGSDAEPAKDSLRPVADLLDSAAETSERAEEGGSTVTRLMQPLPAMFSLSPRATGRPLGLGSVANVVLRMCLAVQFGFAGEELLKEASKELPPTMDDVGENWLELSTMEPSKSSRDEYDNLRACMTALRSDDKACCWICSHWCGG